MKKAFITGIAGQDGSYLSELLLSKGYEVYGLVRRVDFEDEQHRMRRIFHLRNRIQLLPGSIDSFPAIYKAIKTVMPDEIYHLGAQSFVSYSFEDEFSILNTNINGTHYLLSAYKEIVPEAKFYFAGSSEMFGRVTESPQCEKTVFRPRSVYGISKVAGFDLTRNYREAYGLFSCSGILYNHESPRRGREFVTRKITSHAAMIKLGITDRLELGNLDSRRDWGHAREYVEAIWLILQQDSPDDYVICSGITHTVREFCEKAFNYVGMDYKEFVFVNDKLFRPSDEVELCGDNTKAKNKLNWKYTITLDQLVHEMVEADLRFYKDRLK